MIMEVILQNGFTGTSRFNKDRRPRKTVLGGGRNWQAYGENVPDVGSCYES